MLINHIHYNILIKKVSWKEIHTKVHLGQSDSQPCWSVILLKPLWAFNRAKSNWQCLLQSANTTTVLVLQLLLLLTAVISIALYLTDTGEHTVH